VEYCERTTSIDEAARLGVEKLKWSEKRG